MTLNVNKYTGNLTLLCGKEMLTNELILSETHIVFVSYCYRFHEYEAMS